MVHIICRYVSKNTIDRSLVKKSKHKFLDKPKFRVFKKLIFHLKKVLEI